MGRISSSVGLVSGLPTQDIIDQLIGIQARPLATLGQKISVNTQIQAALTGLSASILSLQSSATSLGAESVVSAKNATSSNDSILGISATESAALGSFAFRVLSLTTTQQFISAGLTDTDTTPLGTGTITIKPGGFVDESLSLSLLNGGTGVSRGQIRLTDADGNSAIVDLSTARSTDDVLRAINNSSEVDLLASVSGDAFVLTDVSGGSGNISIEEVNLGSTAVDLGLLSGMLSGGGSVLTGVDVVSVGNLNLDVLNDGLGVRDVLGLDDFRIDLRDGTTSLGIDVSSANSASDVVDLINNDVDNTGSLVASLAADGQRIVLDDSSGGGTLTITALNGSDAPYDLGLAEIVDAGGSLSGGRLIGGLAGPLLRNVNGGSGIGTLGSIRITDRTGAAADIDLTNAETLDDVVAAINAGGNAIEAAVNSAANGIEIRDTSGSTTSDLIIADLGGSTLAADLNLAGSVAADSTNSGDINFRFVSHNTSLDDLNSGQFLVRGVVQISDSNGVQTEIDLTGTLGEQIQTVGDLIDEINAGAANVTARINDTGDGILLLDNAGGTQNLVVTDLTGTVAESVGILGSESGQIDGALRHEIDVTASDTLETLLTKIQQSGAPITASIINDGSGINPFHLLVTSEFSGRAGRVVIDTGDVSIDLSTLTEGADAVLEFGGSSGAQSSLLVTSANNVFDGVLDGVTLTATGVSSQTVSVNITDDPAPLKDAINSFVSAFNSVQSSIKDLTFFDVETEVRGLLQGDSTARRLEIALFDLVTKSYGDGGDILRLADIGLGVRDGRLQFDEAVLDSQLAADPEGVKSFLDASQVGAADAMEDFLDSFTSAIDGSITTRVRAIDDQNADLEAQAEQLQDRLDQQRIRLERQFLQMEIAIAKAKSLEGTLTQLQQLATFAQSVGTRK